MGRRGIHVLLIVSILVLVTLLGVENVSSSTYIVPIDYPDLHTAVAGASPGSTIYVDTWQSIASPININGKSGLTIVFRGVGIQTTSPYSSSSLLRVTGSSDVLIMGLEIRLGDVSAPSLSLVEIVGSQRVRILGLSASYNGAAEPWWLFGVAIRGSSDDITLTNLAFRDLSARSLVSGVLVHFVSTNGFDMVLNGLQMIDATSQGSVEGVTLATPTMDGWRVSLTNIWLYGLRGYGWGVFGVHIPGYSLVRNTSIYITHLYAHDIGARLWPEAVNIWSVFGTWRDSRLVVRNFDLGGFISGYYPYSGIWINIANFDNASIRVERGRIHDLPQPLVGDSHGIGVNLGMPVPPTSRNKVGLVIRDVTVWDTNYGFRVMGTNTAPASDVNVLVANSTAYNADVGLGLGLSNLNKYVIGVENYRYLNRTGIGIEISMSNLLSDQHPGPPPTSLSTLRASEDLYIAYSLVWTMTVDYTGPVSRATIYESVLDEHASTSDPDMPFRSIWTLETIVRSSLTNSPVPNVAVSIRFPDPAPYSSGSTDMQGRYSTLMDYYWSSVYVNTVWIGASKSGRNAQTMLDQYIWLRLGDAPPTNLYTLPSWYGQVILFLDILYLRVVGFSHDLGTTVLVIDGSAGYFASKYHRKPIDLPNKPYSIHTLVVTRVYGGPLLLVIEGYIHYLGERWPTVIYVNKIDRMIYSPGPIDFRGYY